MLNPLNILIVLQPGLGTPNEYEQLIKERFPDKVASGNSYPFIPGWFIS